MIENLLVGDSVQKASISVSHIVYGSTFLSIIYTALFALIMIEKPVIIKVKLVNIGVIYFNPII